MLERSKKSKFSILFLLLLMTLLGVFPLDVILPSFPALSEHFDTPSANIALSVSLFAIGFSVSQFFLGPLSDRLGRKRLLLLGLLVSLAGAVGSASCVQFSSFIFFRLVQAIGCGCFVLTNALVQDIFEGDERDRIRILMTTAGGLFISTSPLLGTWLQYTFDWPGSFYLFALIAGAMLIHTRWVLPNEVARPLTTRFWSSCGAILSNGRFMGFSLIAAIAFTCHFSFIVISPVIFLDEFHLAPLQFSLILLGYGAAYAMGGVIASRLQRAIPPKRQLTVGLTLIGLAGLVLFSLHLSMARGFLTIMLPMLICTTGTTIARPAATSRAMELFPSQAGAAASMLNTTVFVVGGILSAVAGLSIAHFEVALASGFLLLGASGWAITSLIYRPHASRQNAPAPLLKHRVK